METTLRNKITAFIVMYNITQVLELIERVWVHIGLPCCNSKPSHTGKSKITVLGVSYVFAPHSDVAQILTLTLILTQTLNTTDAMLQCCVKP